MTRRIALYLIILAVFALGIPVQAADNVEVTLQVSQKVVTINEPLQVTVSVTGKGFRSLPSPTLPESSMFQVVGTSTGHNISMMNTKMVVSKTANYTLMPLRAGRTRIGPASVKVRGKTYRSNSVEIQVADAGNTKPPQANAPDTKDQSDLIFLKAVAEPEDPFLGSQVTVSLYLYTRMDLTGLSSPSLPDFNNFWAEELPTSNRPNFQSADVGDVQYQAALVHRFALFPLKAGQTRIEPYTMTARFRAPSKRRQRSFGWGFDEDIFGVFGSQKQVELVSEPIDINVRPLPREEQPETFQNVIGRFKMNVSMDKTRVAAGDPVTLNMVITGEGNFKTLVAPRVQIPSTINTFSETSEQDIRSTANRVGGTKTFSMILVPREEGNFDIGPITLDYFDPKAQIYKRLTAGPLSIDVAGVASGGISASGPVTQREVLQSGEDIRYIRGDAKRLNEQKVPYYKSIIFLVFCGCWPFMAALVFFVRRVRQKATADEDKYRSRKAGRVVRIRLKKARSMMDASAGDFYTELTGAVLGFIADKTGQSATGIVIAELVSELRKVSADEELPEMIRDLFRQADAVRYGGQKADKKARKEALNKAMKVLDGLSDKKLLNRLGKE